ncbi:MAG: prepilin-type N-terminal cleavage/methylation domain-containing protein [Deltaproteobacteria bacterium]|nr:prepilin-type N-terminal cleavage/methylation domain-containing protein [Deltaproteobacteria bacterium]
MNNKGYTLVEILMALAVGMVLLAAVYGAVNSSQRSSSGIERKVVAQQDARSALELMAIEIRMASYDQDMDTSIWRDPSASTCHDASANPTYRGIQEATENSMTIEMDIGDSGAVGDNGNEIIRYNYDSANHRLTRQTMSTATGNCSFSTAFSILGDLEASKKTVRVINDQNGNNTYDSGTDIPVFRYFNGAGTEIFPGTTPASIPTIRTIEITLAVETSAIDPMTKQKRKLVYSTRVTPRNHAITQ